MKLNNKCSTSHFCFMGCVRFHISENKLVCSIALPRKSKTIKMYILLKADTDVEKNILLEDENLDLVLFIQCTSSTWEHWHV